MSEELLKALLQLFALASSDDDLTSESRSIVERFLTSELGNEQVDEYILYYDKCLKDIPSETKTKGTIDVDRVQKVCEKSNESLVQQQKLTLLLRLLEYILADENISDHELSFLKSVVDFFNIPEGEFEEALAFASGSDRKTEYTPNLLIIDEEKPEDQDRGKFLEGKNLHGQLRILYFESVNTYTLRYFGSESLYLNGQSVIPGNIYIFTNGSAIRGSLISPIYYSDITSMYMEDSETQTLVFEAEKIEYEFPGGNKGLHEFSIYEKNGRLIGIMGGSGAGKSTLLNVLNGNLPPTKGSVKINGYDINRDQDVLKGVVGYVSQDDLLIEDLTVFQNLYYNAKLCFDNLSDEEIRKKVLNLLEILGLYEARNLKVGSPVDKVISGGQRKRLNIALELIREPGVLFVDEPTSGLSSRDSENIMDLLKQLTLKGKLVFVVIHQPSSDIFKLFDKLIILDLGGYPVYYGDPVESIIYFKQQTRQVNSEESECPSCGNVNPEQIFNTIETKVIDEYGNVTGKRKVSPEAWYKEYKKQLEPAKFDASEEEIDKPESDLKKPGIFKQFTIFVTRDVLSKIANRQYMLINFLEAPVLAFILSYFIKYSANPKGETYTYHLLDNENLPAYIFMAVIVALFIGLTVSAEEIIRDRKIRKREQFLDLSKGSYLWSKMIILFVLSALQMLLFAVIGNWVMEIKEMTFYYWAALFSTAAFANLLGLNISASFNSAVTIYIMIPFLIIPQLIFSGVIVKFDKLNPDVSARSHVPLIGEVMASRWAFEALAVGQFMYNKLGKETYEYDKKMSAVDYHRTYRISEIKSRLNLAEPHAGEENLPEDIERALTVIKNELNTGDPLLGYPTRSFEWKPGDKEFNLDQIRSARNYLDKLKTGLNRQYRIFASEKDKMIGEINSRYEDESFSDLKKKHMNTSLEDLVTNKSELNRVIEIDGSLFQQQNPVYYNAQAARAHFYSPDKLVAGKSVPTYWFNLGVIWLMTVILMITLYFDVFRKILNLFSVKLRRR